MATATPPPLHDPEDAAACHAKLCAVITALAEETRSSHSNADDTYVAKLVDCLGTNAMDCCWKSLNLAEIFSSMLSDSDVVDDSVTLFLRLAAVAIERQPHLPPNDPLFALLASLRQRPQPWRLDPATVHAWMQLGQCVGNVDELGKSLLALPDLATTILLHPNSPLPSRRACARYLSGNTAFEFDMQLLLDAVHDRQQVDLLDLCFDVLSALWDRSDAARNEEMALKLQGKISDAMVATGPVAQLWSFAHLLARISVPSPQVTFLHHLQSASRHLPSILAAVDHAAEKLDASLLESVITTSLSIFPTAPARTQPSLLRYVTRWLDLLPCSNGCLDVIVGLVQNEIDGSSLQMTCALLTLLVHSARQSQPNLPHETLYSILHQAWSLHSSAWDVQDCCLQLLTCLVQTGVDDDASMDLLCSALNATSHPFVLCSAVRCLCVGARSYAANRFRKNGRDDWTLVHRGCLPLLYDLFCATEDKSPQLAIIECLTRWCSEGFVGFSDADFVQVDKLALYDWEVKRAVLQHVEMDLQNSLYKQTSSLLSLSHSLSLLHGRQVFGILNEMAYDLEVGDFAYPIIQRVLSFISGRLFDLFDGDVSVSVEQRLGNAVPLEKPVVQAITELYSLDLEELRERALCSKDAFARQPQQLLDNILLCLNVDYDLDCY